MQKEKKVYPTHFIQTPPNPNHMKMSVPTSSYSLEIAAFQIETHIPLCPVACYHKPKKGGQTCHRARGIVHNILFDQFSLY